MAVWLELGLSLLVLMAMALVGWLVLRLCRIDDPWLAVGMAFPTGLGLTAWAWFLVSWAGFPLNKESLLWTWAGLASLGMAAVSMTRALRRAAPGPRVSVPRSYKAADMTVAAFLAALILVSGWLSVGRSYSGWDDMSAYARQGYAIAREGSVLAVAGWQPSAQGYPISIPMAIAAFRLLGLEGLPGSKLIFPVLLACLLVASHAFWRKWCVPGWLAVTGVVLLGTAPTVFEHSTLGYTNLPEAVFLALGLMACAEGMEDHPRGHLSIGGLLLGFAAFTRPEGMQLATVALACLAASGWLFHRPGVRVLLSLASAAIVTIPWIVFARVEGLPTHLSAASESAAAQILRGSVHIDAIYWTVRYLLRSALRTFAWGGVPIAAFALLLRAAGNGRWKSQFGAAHVLVTGLGTGLATVLFYYVVSFSGDIQFWLGTGVERMFLPAVILCWVGALGVAGGVGRDRERAVTQYNSVGQVTQPMPDL